MVNRSELKKLLPHGSGKIIAQKANVSITSVSMYFNNKINSERIENAALKLAAEVQNQKQSLLDILKLL